VKFPRLINHSKVRAGELRILSARANMSHSSNSTTKRKNDHEPAAVEVQMKNTRQKLWLFKVPDFVMDAWNENATGGSELGSLTMMESGGKSVMTFKPNIGLLSNVSAEFSVQDIHMDSEPIEFFSYAKGKSLSKAALEGEVDKRYELKSLDTPQFHAFCQDRTTRIGPDTPVSVDDEMPRRHLRLPTANNDRILDRVYADKRVREENVDVVEARIFEAFAKNPVLSLADLENETSQPRGYLKELLDRLCVKSKSGRSRAMYELKPEYRLK
jgi:hypothetical protein